MFNLGRVQSVFAKCGSHSTTNTTPFVILTAGSLYGMMMETIRLTERGCGQADVETLAVTLGFFLNCTLLPKLIYFKNTKF